MNTKLCGLFAAIIFVIALAGPAPAQTLSDTVTIAEIQYNQTTPGSGDDCYPSPRQGQEVVISGIVTAIAQAPPQGLWLQDGTSSWSGVAVMGWPVDPIHVGDRLVIGATVGEYFGRTQLTDITWYEAVMGTPVDPIHILSGHLAQSCDAGSEAWEGCLVRLLGATCTYVDYNLGEWLVDDGSGPCWINNRLYYSEPFVGEVYDIVGVVDYFNGLYRLLPRSGDDVTVPVELVSFQATAGDGRVTLSWRTAAEVDILSFHIYRDEQKIASIPACGDAHDYLWVDRRVTNGVTYSYRLSDVGLDGSETLHPMVCTATPGALPAAFALEQNHPNPFNPTTRIGYAIGAQSRVSLRVYNPLGQEVAVLVDEVRPAGRHSATWDATGQASGLYFYRLETEQFSASRKMVLVR